MENIEWKSFKETISDPELDIDLTDNGKLLPGRRYSFYSAPTDRYGQYQKTTGVFESLDPEIEGGEATFVDCKDENGNPLIGKRIGYRKFKLEEGSDTLGTNETGTEMTYLESKQKPDYSATRPYNEGGTKKRRRYRKQKTKRRRKTTRKRKPKRKIN